VAGAAPVGRTAPGVVEVGWRCEQVDVSAALFLGFDPVDRCLIPRQQGAVQERLAGQSGPATDAVIEVDRSTVTSWRSTSRPTSLREIG
jgi:hypothetical protein